MRKYSIILPTYNSENYIQACVNSILSQTYTHFNLIILDSFSTDNTISWIKTIKDDRIKIYPVQKRIYIAENWARVQMVERNEFMTFIGHDDVLLPHYLAEIDSLIQDHPHATLYQSHFNFIDVKGRYLYTCLPMDEIQQAHELLACLMTKTLDSMATGYIFRTQDYDKAGGISVAYPDLLFADNELWIKLTKFGYKATAHRICFSYRVHQSLSRTTTGMHYYQSFSQYMLFLKSLIENSSEMKEVISRYGTKMLTQYCEAVSHRLLKTPLNKRSITVGTFLSECKIYSDWFIPGQNFNPKNIKRIRLADKLDSNKVLRRTFQLFRKWYAGKI